MLGRGLGKADINIVGGDGQFFDKFVQAVGVGNMLDGFVQHSETPRRSLLGAVA